MINQWIVWYIICVSCFTQAAYSWRMPTPIDEYDGSKQSPLVQKKVPLTTAVICNTSSLACALKHANQNYGDDKKPIPPATFDTPMRLATSYEFNQLRESQVGVSYSPRKEHSPLCERMSIAITDSCLYDVSQIADGIADQWYHAHTSIQNAQLVVSQQNNMTFEEVHHHRAQCLIIGLNVFYKYKDIMATDQQEHRAFMLELLLATRISLAIATPVNPGRTRKAYRYNKSDNYEQLYKKYLKLNTKLAANDTITVEYAFGAKTSTSPIAIPSS